MTMRAVDSDWETTSLSMFAGYWNRYSGWVMIASLMTMTNRQPACSRREAWVGLLCLNTDCASRTPFTTQVSPRTCLPRSFFTTHSPRRASKSNGGQEAFKDRPQNCGGAGNRSVPSRCQRAFASSMLRWGQLPRNIGVVGGKKTRPGRVLGCERESYRNLSVMMHIIVVW